MLALLVQHQADCPLTNFRRKLVRRLAHRRPFLSGVRASGNPGAVHTIVCGYGTTGTEAAAELMREGIAPEDIVVIDLNSERLENAEALGMGTVMGDATQNAVLESAAVDRANAVIICPSRDDSAVLISLTAKRMAPRATRVVAIRSTENEVLALGAGADVIVNPVSFAGRMLAGALRGPHVTEYLDDLITARGRIKLHEREVKNSEIGLSLIDVGTGVGLRLYRDGRAFARWDEESKILKSGDKIIEIIPTSRD